MMLDAALARTEQREGEKTVYHATINTQLRSRFEEFGEHVLALAVAAGEHSSKGAELDKLLHEERPQIIEWLRERRDAAQQLESARFTTIKRWTITSRSQSAISLTCAK